jgi:hypothetical protein
MDLDLTTLGALLFVAAPLVLLILRVFVIPDGASLEDLIAPRMEMEWPQGVQEEEPVPWRTELLSPRDRRAQDATRRSLVRDVSRVPGP